MIKVQNLKKIYGNSVVVEDVSIELPKGKMIAFIGSNGAGKSTVLSMTARLLKRDGGSVFVDDKKIEDWNHKELAKRLSILKQSNHLNVRLTVKELVAFGRFPYEKENLKAEDIKIVTEAMDYVGLQGLENRYLDELSGGQRQMAYIAMVIAQDTEYIFLDEPLNNLDMKHSVQIMKVLERLTKEKGKTVVVVIHDINYVSCYADYIIAMKNGKIHCHGATKDIINTETLLEIYDMNITIQKVNGKNICIYYREVE